MSISSGDDSGLATTDGTSIFLFDKDGVIEGRVGDETGDVAFSISIASDTGEVTLTQYLSLYHSDATDNDDPMFLADGVIKAVVTVTDGDGDEDDAEVDISGLFTFEDDGPTASIGLVYGEDQETPASIVVDETDDADNAGLPGILGQASAFVVSSFGSDPGADEEGATTVFSLSISSGDDSGLATTDGTSIFLFDKDGVIEGRVGDETGDVAFSISIASDTGEVTLTQYLSLYHSDATDNDDPMFLADGVIKAVVTVTDGDGDEDDAEVDISGLFTFEDDGPTASIGLVYGEDQETPASIVVDETDDADNAGLPGILGQASASRGEFFRFRSWR